VVEIVDTTEKIALVEALLRDAGVQEPVMREKVR
jgi:hypothetical protein